MRSTLSLQAQQQLNQWEQEEAAAYQARLQAAESRCSHAASARLLGLEEQAIASLPTVAPGFGQLTSRTTEHHCNKRLGFTTRIFNKNCFTIKMLKPKLSLYLQQKDSSRRRFYRSRPTNGRRPSNRSFLEEERRQSKEKGPSLSKPKVKPTSSA